MKPMKHKVESFFIPKVLTFKELYRHIKPVSMSTFRLNITFVIQDFIKNKYDPRKTEN